jgi:ferredoxin-NADP reductase
MTYPRLAAPLRGYVHSIHRRPCDTLMPDEIDLLSLTHARTTATRLGLVHKVLEVRHLTETTFVVRIERNNVPATAGQCVTLGVHGSGINREYSLYSGEHDDYFEFLVREIEGGQVSQELKKLAPGAVVDFDGPYGKFILERPADTQRRYVFIATGVGIAPYHSFISTHPDLDYTVVHGVRYLRERYEYEFYDRARYIACLTREAGGDFKGRVTDYLRAHPVEPGVICYLCGNNAMIAEVYDLLRAQGVPGDQLFTEIFF